MTESRTLHGLLTESSAEFPNRTAVVDPRHGSITYSELDAMSTLLCGSLREEGVQYGDRLGICAPKCLGTVASMFAILKSGAAYVPVDVTAPIRRSATIFQDCWVKAVVVHQTLVDKLIEQFHRFGVTVVRSQNWKDPFNCGLSLVVVEATTDQPQQEKNVDLAYILYTSGSTGRPKGVIHSHRSALSFVDWCSGEFEPTTADVFSSHAPFHFDLSILDVFVPIKHGASVVLIGEEIGKQPLGLADLIADESISVWYSTPSILRLLVEFGKLSKRRYPTLRLVLFAGEVFPIKHLHALQQIWTKPRYYNLYGPTETNVCTFHAVAKNVKNLKSLPIGKVCSGDRARVVDEVGMDVVPGEKGELIISGG